MILGKQHITKAVSLEREAMLKANKVVPKTMNMVTAQVLKFDTPLYVRKWLSGANNASGHSVHAITISDALDNFLANEKIFKNKQWRDERGSLVDPTFAQRVLRMLEESGLNTAGQTIVCHCNYMVIHYNLFSSQVNLLSYWKPVCKLASVCGERVPKAIRLMEMKHKLQIGAFEKVGALMTTSQYEELADALDEPNANHSMIQRKCRELSAQLWF